MVLTARIASQEETLVQNEKMKWGTKEHAVTNKMQLEQGSRPHDWSNPVYGRLPHWFTVRNTETAWMGISRMGSAGIAMIDIILSCISL